MPERKDARGGAGRNERVAARTREAGWRKAPRRIEASECITCDSCLRSCPEEFGAIVNRGLDVVIVPELCSGCPACVVVCPVDCIYVDQEWQASDNSLWNLVEPTCEGSPVR